MTNGKLSSTSMLLETKTNTTSRCAKLLGTIFLYTFPQENNYMPSHATIVPALGLHAPPCKSHHKTHATIW